MIRGGKTAYNRSHSHVTALDQMKRSAWAMLSNHVMRSPRPAAISRDRRMVSSSQLSRCPSTSFADQRSWVRGRCISASGIRATSARVDRRTVFICRIALRRHAPIDAALRLAMSLRR